MLKNILYFVLDPVIILLLIPRWTYLLQISLFRFFSVLFYFLTNTNELFNAYTDMHVKIYNLYKNMR